MPARQPPIPELAAGDDGGAGAGARRCGECSLEADAEWSLLVQSALAHGVMPHVHAAIRRVAPDAPAWLPKEIGRCYRANTARSLFAAAELIELLLELEARGIRAVPLKGPVLAARAYGALGMRQFTDLDVLVPPGDVAGARAVLASRGYHVRGGEETSLTAVRSSDGQRMVVDLQWDLAEPRYGFPLRPAQLFAALEPVPFMNTTVWQPAPADQLLLLCAHAAKHCWSRIGWICDIAAFLRAHGERIDFERLLGDARRSGAERLLLIGMSLTGDVTGVEPPAQVRTRARADRVALTIAAEIRDRLLPGRPPARLNGSYGFVDAALLYVRSRERAKDKVPYLLYLVRTIGRALTLRPNELDRRVVSLPRALSFAYYLVRPARLARKYGARALAYGFRLALCWR